MITTPLETHYMRHVLYIKTPSCTYNILFLASIGFHTFKEVIYSEHVKMSV